MPLTMPTCLVPASVFNCAMTSTGISECSARGWLPVSIVHSSFRLPTLCLVRIFSFLAQPVRWLSPPSVSQSTSGAAFPDCACNAATPGSDRSIVRLRLKAATPPSAIAVHKVRFFITLLIQLSGDQLPAPSAAPPRLRGLRLEAGSWKLAAGSELPFHRDPERVDGAVVGDDVDLAVAAG